MDIILASASPRRRGLFSLIADSFLTAEPDIDESAFCALPAEEQAGRLAEQKCLSVAAGYPGAVVVGCDTLVECGGRVFGKPGDESGAFAMLRALSGRTHTVYTGVAVRMPACFSRFCCGTAVTFFEMTDDEIRSYVASGEPLDKAGAYGIQGMAARYIREIRGDYFNVMGLPVSRLYRELRAHQIV